MASTTRSMEATTNSRLLMLPPELRNMIWQHVIVPEDQTRQIQPKPYHLSCAEWAPPALSRTCHEIRQETIPMFYGQNAFVFSVTGFGPFFAILRRALTYLRMTSPGTRLDNFHLEIKGHYPLCIEDLVEYARIFGVCGPQLPRGPVPLQGVYRKEVDVAMTAMPAFAASTLRAQCDFGAFLQDLACLGRRLHEGRAAAFAYDRYAEAIREMLTEPGIGPDHFRRFIILDCMEGLARFREQQGMSIPAWVALARSRGEIVD